MTRQIMPATMLVAFTNLTFGGCTHMVKAKLYETGHLQHNKIAGVALDTGEAVRFAEPGGSFNPHSKNVTGPLKSGENVTWSLHTLDRVLVQTRVYGQPLTFDIQTADFSDYYRKNIVKHPKNVEIREVATVAGQTFKFERPGARIHVQDSTLVGINASGYSVSVPLSDVEQVMISRPNKNLTTAVALVGLAVVGIAIAVAVAIRGYQGPFGQTN